MYKVLSRKNVCFQSGNQTITAKFCPTDNSSLCRGNASISKF